MKTFTINGLSELLEKDRGLVVRALRGVAPDATQNGRPRYRAAVAVAALERHQGIAHAGGGSATQARLNALYAQYDAECDLMEAAPTLEERRKIALTRIALTMHHTQVALLEHGAAIRDEFCHSLLADKLYGLAMAGVRVSCEWGHDEAWRLMGAAMPDAEAS